MVGTDAQQIAFTVRTRWRPTARHWLRTVSFSLALGLNACTTPSPVDDPDDPNAVQTTGEHLVAEIGAVDLPLDDTLADPELEISGLAWYGDHLILLPENLGRGFSLFGGLAAGPQFVLAVDRADIEALIDRTSTAPLVPRKIPVTPAIDGQVPRFDGFEAIAFDGDHAYLSIETMQDDTGYIDGVIVHGKMASDLSALELDFDSASIVRSQTARPNASEEAILVDDQRVFSIYELNGARINDSPGIHELSDDLRQQRRHRFPVLEYRVTDATETDADGRFWVVNYSWPGSSHKDVQDDVHPDPIRDRHGSGPTHAQYEQVERLVELQLEPDGSVSLTDRPPIQLELTGDWSTGASRNWEGIARMGDRGFLIVTDRFPTTILAFVPWSH